MQPRLSIIAASIRRILTSGFVEPTSDPYWDNTVLSLRMESSDPYYNQVVLLMHMEDAGLTDVKGHTITLVGNAARSATQAKFGTYSAYFDGVGDYLTSPNSTDFNFGSGDFTVECWIRPESLAQEAVFIHRGNTTGYDAWSLTLSTNGKVSTLGSVTGSAYAWAVEGSKVLSVSTWYHIALVRSGTTIMTFIDGILDVLVTGVSGSLYAPTVTLKIGCDSSGSVYEFTGYIDDVRITKGVARYTKNFIIPSAAFPEPANTAIDDKGKTVTSNGNAQFSGVSKYGTGSFYFDGTGDYLSVPNSGEFSFGSSDFTIETWVYFNSVSGLQSICDGRGTTNDYACAWSFSLGGYGHSGKITFLANSTAYNTSSAAFEVDLYSTLSPVSNTWYHIAVSRSGTSWKLFINGTLEASATVTLTIGAASPTIHIGSAVNGPSTMGYALNGYLDDLRITSGVARYTSAFTPYKIVTSAPAGDTYYNYTTLLLKMNGTNGGTTFTDNSYSPKTVSVFGNSNTSTAAFKYGTASGSFDGTGDYLTIPYDAGFAPSGDFTCECWIYSTDVTSLRAIIGPYSYPTGVSNGWLLAQDVSGGLSLTLRASNGDYQVLVSSDGVIKINRWHHVAWTRAGTVYTVFLDGVVVATATATVTLYVHPSHPLLIGRWDDSPITTRDWQGYIDDVRITNGVARYTSSFTPPGPHIANTDPDTDQWWLNTVLALRMDGTHGSAIFTDLKGKTVTANGNVSISSEMSKFGQAAYLDGTGDYLSVTGSTFGTGDFCVEAWVYPTVNNNALIIFDNRIGDTDSNGFAFYLRGTGKLAFIYSASVVVEGTTTYSANTWHHVAVTRISGTVKMYLNGVQEASFAQTNDYSNTGWKIGHQWNVTGSHTPGYIDDLRITQGVGRYTAAFTPSEKPLPTYQVGPDHDTYWDKVVLATPFNSDTSCARGKTLTAMGGATISSTTKKFGSGSLFLDGTNDYVTTTDYDDLDIGSITSSTNWTLDCWIYPTNVSAGGVIVTHAVPGSGGTGRGGWTVSVGAGGTIGVNFAHNVSRATNLFCFGVTTANPILNNEWVHLAVVLVNGVQSVYIDGVKADLTMTATNGYYQATPIGLDTTKLNWGIDIGRIPNDSTNPAGGYLAGYIDDLRITKGIARYTTSFELPTKANILG